MSLDPNVQVALVSVFATLITTLGVVAVAMINNKKERAKAADAGVEAGLDERDVLTRLLALISEVDEKKAKIAGIEVEMTKLLEINRELRAENTLLRLELNALPTKGDADDN